MLLLPCPGTGKLLPSEQLLLWARAGGQEPLNEQFLPQNGVGDKKYIYFFKKSNPGQQLGPNEAARHQSSGPETSHLFQSLKGHCPPLSPGKGPALGDAPWGLLSASARPLLPLPKPPARPSSGAGGTGAESPTGSERPGRRERPEHQKVLWAGGPGEQPVCRGRAAVPVMDSEE